MTIKQSFLPVRILGMGQILGAVAIPETTFTGSETSYTLGGYPYPISRQDVTSVVGSGGSVSTHSFMSLDVDSSQARRHDHQSIPGFNHIDDLYGFLRWVMPKNVCQMQGNTPTPILRLLMGAAAHSVVSSVPPSPSVSTTNFDWTVECTLGSAPACSFFDLDWVTGFQGYSSLTPTEIVLGSPVPGSISSSLKTFILHTDTPVDPVLGPGPAFNTIRFIKMVASPLLSGTYNYPLTVGTAEGVFVTGTLTLTIS